MVRILVSCAVALLVAGPPTPARAQSSSAAASSQAGTDDRAPRLTLGNHTIRFGVDLGFGLVQDEALRESLGRERQIKVAFANFSAFGALSDHVSYRITINPADDHVVPRPYIPSADDRRAYFFPNTPEGRGVASDPAGLYSVDDYKHPGLDPILQQGLLRVGYVDLHTRRGASGRQLGALIGRSYVPQGLGVDDVVWYTAKDLTHIQRINFQADNGLFAYFTMSGFRLDAAVITGNGNPYHDYGYFDFTAPTEDKNSALGAVLSARFSGRRFFGGVSFRKNYLNSRIEDSISLQLSKHNDDAIVVFGSVSPFDFIRVYGEWARYRWGLAGTSAELLPGPAVRTPVFKPGYYIGVDLSTPTTRLGRFRGSLIHERISRDDALVAWAAANSLFGVRLGEQERTTIVKFEAEPWRGVGLFVFYNDLANPFPVLSALVPIYGAGAGGSVQHYKYGLGVRVRIQ